MWAKTYQAEKNCCHDKQFQFILFDPERSIAILFSLTGNGIRSCNIRPEDTYRRKTKLSLPSECLELCTLSHIVSAEDDWLTSKQSFACFSPSLPSQYFSVVFSNIGSTKTLLLSASVKTLKLTRLHAEIMSSWLGLSIPRPRGHS